MYKNVPRLFKELLGELWSGLVFWLPIGVIVFIGSYIFSSLESFGTRFLQFFLPEEFIYAGFGVLLWIIVFLLTGLMLKYTSVGDLLSRVPLLGILFRKKGGKVIPVGTPLGMTPCLFLYSPTCPSYGWTLSEETVRIKGEEAGFTIINVYYPNVPSIVTGQVFPVRKASTIKLANPSREIIDLLLYALRSPESIHYLPWENETEDEFRHWAESFGVKVRQRRQAASD